MEPSARRQLPPVAAVVAFEGFARVPIGDAEIAKNRDRSNAADARKIFTAAGGAFRVVIKRAQTSYIASNSLLILLFPFLIFLLVKLRITVNKLFAHDFLKINYRVRPFLWCIVTVPIRFSIPPCRQHFPFTFRTFFFSTMDPYNQLFHRLLQNHMLNNNTLDPYHIHLS